MTSKISSSIENQDPTETRVSIDSRDFMDDRSNFDSRDPIDDPDSVGQSSGDTCLVTYRSAGFFSRQRELLKRRLWPAALTLVCCLLYYVVGTATALTLALQELSESSGSYGYTAAERLSALTEAVSAMMGHNSITPFILSLPLAAVLAIEGFAWMDSRREVDFYESQPLSRTQRFLDICVSSFLYFLFSHVVSTGIGLILAGAMGALSRGILLEILLQTFRSTAMFLSVYSLGVLSAMLTGNVIVAALAFCVLLLYEIEFKAILKGLCHEFLSTYDGHPPAALDRYIFSPLYHVTAASTPESVARLLALAAFFFLLAFLSYRLRKNELAESAVVFGPVRSIVRVAMAVIIGLFVGLLFASVQKDLFIAIIWMLLFALLTACIMQIIYDYDFRALFRRPLEIAAALAITLAVFLGFLFDIAGFDRYLPDPSKVSEAALICHNYDTLLCNEKGQSLDPVTYGDQYMHLDNIEDVIAIAGFGQEYTRQQSKKELFHRTSPRDITQDGTAAAIDMGSYEILSQEKPGQVFLFTARYRMKNGRTIYRRFMIPSSADPAMMDAVTGTQAFREGTFNIYHDEAARKTVDKLNLVYSNGEDISITLHLNSKKYEEFRKACLLDLEQFSYSFARASRPVGRVVVSYYEDRKGFRNQAADSRIMDDQAADSQPIDNHAADSQPIDDQAADSQPIDNQAADSQIIENFDMNYEVYASFDHTIAFLKENGLWSEPLDYDSLPRYYDESLSQEDRDRIDRIDWSVFDGLFNPAVY